MEEERRHHEHWPWQGVRQLDAIKLCAPSDIAVAKLAESHGFQACVERWGYISPKVLQKMLFDGRQQLRKSAK